MIDYAEIRDGAADAIKAAGKSYTFTKKIQRVFDAVLGEYSSISSTYRAYAVVTNIRKQKDDSDDRVKHDMEMIATAANFQTFDRVTINSQTYTIQSCEPVAPGGIDVVYILRLVKS